MKTNSCLIFLSRPTNTAGVQPISAPREHIGFVSDSYGFAASHMRERESSGAQKSDEPCSSGSGNSDLFRLIDVKLCSQRETAEREKSAARQKLMCVKL